MFPFSYDFEHISSFLLLVISFYSPGQTGTYYIVQAGFKLMGNPPASALQMLGLKVRASIPSQYSLSSYFFLLILMCVFICSKWQFFLCYK